MGKKKRQDKRGMARQKRKRSGEGFPGANFMRGSRVSVFFLYIIFIAGGIFGLRYFFLNSPVFDIKEIVVNKDWGYSFREGEGKLKRLYIGRNMFTVDLKQVQSLIKDDFPQLKKVEVKKIFPDRMELDIVSRVPVAVINSGGGVVIDADGIVLTVGEVPRDLVKIKGINFFLNIPPRGGKITNGSLDKALDLLGQLNRKLGKDRSKVEYMDISDNNNIILYVSGVPVKMGIDGFSEKTDELKEMLADPNIDMKDIEYIDLRFEAAVIAPK
ncbi:MAG: cell division protein FtsQ/DivIB [Candidatus Omnitrophota bacterium]